jgi:hypothetical protein
MISNFELYKRLFTALIAVLQPFIIYFSCGDLISLSQSWSTPLQPLFIFTNALVSYFFFDLPHWRIPAVFLLLLTVFSVEDYNTLHNVLAVGFFISCIFPLWSIKRFRLYIPVYLLSIIFLRFDGLYWMETWAIIVLCFYHVHVMLYTKSIHTRNHPDSL